MNRRRAGTYIVLIFAALIIIAAAIEETIYTETEIETPEPTTIVHTFTLDSEGKPVETGKRYNVPLDDDLVDWIVEKCGNDVSPKMVLAIIAVETGGTWDAGVIGDSGHSYGLMQIYADCHTERCIKLNAVNLLDPYQNTAVGIDILRELNGYGKGPEWTLMAYNGGPSYADSMTENGNVSRYAKRVMVLMDVITDV